MINRRFYPRSKTIFLNNWSAKERFGMNSATNPRVVSLIGRIPRRITHHYVLCHPNTANLCCRVGTSVCLYNITMREKGKKVQVFFFSFFLTHGLFSVTVALDFHFSTQLIKGSFYPREKIILEKFFLGRIREKNCLQFIFSDNCKH